MDYDQQQINKIGQMDRSGERTNVQRTITNKQFKRVREQSTNLTINHSSKQIQQQILAVNQLLILGFMERKHMNTLRH